MNEKQIQSEFERGEKELAQYSFIAEEKDEIMDIIYKYMQFREKGCSEGALLSEIEDYLMNNNRIRRREDSFYHCEKTLTDGKTNKNNDRIVIEHKVSFIDSK